MTEPSAPVPDPRRRRRGAGRGKPLAGAFRWQAFFGRTADPVFVLDRRRRLLFVNAAWESLTGVPAGDAHRLVCRRPRPAGPGDPPHAVVEHALTPPPEVRQGATMRVRRLLPGREPARRWWDVDFFPLRQQGEKAAVLILGRITPAAAEESAPAAPLPERLVALRERTTQRFGPELLSDASPALRRLAEQVRLAGRTTAPVLLVGEPGVGKRTLARLIHYQGPTSGTALRRPRLRPPAGRGAGGRAVRRSAHGPRGDLPSRTVAPAARPAITPLRTRCMPRRRRRGSTRALLAGCGVDPAEEVRAGRLLDELYSRPGRADAAPSAAARASRPTCRRWWTGCWSAATPRAKPTSRACRPTPGTWSATTPGRATSASCTPSCRRPGGARGDRITAADLPASLRLLRRMEETPGRRPERPLPLDALLEEAERRLIDMALASGERKEVPCRGDPVDPAHAADPANEGVGHRATPRPTTAARSDGPMRLPQIVVHERTAG